MLDMRLFVALVPPEDVLGDLDEFLSVRREAEAFRWTLPEQWHVTLAFAPDVAERHLDDLVERLGRAAARRTPFRTRFAGGGGFPNAGRARVLYAGMDLTTPARSELTRLATGARAAISKAGAEVAGGRFRPHLTLARLGRSQEVSNWVRLLDGYAGPEWDAASISLIESHLGEGPRRRPRYATVETFQLGRAANR